MPLDLSKISRDCITCDGPGCDKPSPAKRCSRCHTEYYCSPECQKRAWKGHKPYCISVDVMKSKMVDAKPPPTDVEINEPCAICLDEVRNPMLLPCDHAFCYHCLVEYQTDRRRFAMNPNLTVPCPLCRGATTDIKIEALARAFESLTMANHSSVDSASKKCILEAALTSGVESWDTGRDLQGIHVQAEALASLGRKDEARAALEKYLVAVDEASQASSELQSLFGRVDEARHGGDEDTAERLLEEAEEILHSKCTQRIAGSSILDHLSVVAELWMRLDQWEKALDTFHQLLEHPGVMSSPPFQRKAFAGMAQCFYEMGLYERALCTGEASLEMNRHYPGAHRIVAMIHRKNGSLEEARRIMKRAVIYETPWDMVNKEEQFMFYEELMRDPKM